MNLVRRDSSHGSHVSAYRPRSLDEQVGRMVEDMFEDLFSSTLMPYSPVSRIDQDVITPRVNLRETDQAYEVEADIPGIEKDDVRISIENRRVTIEAEEKMEATSPQAGEGGRRRPGSPRNRGNQDGRGSSPEWNATTEDMPSVSRCPRRWMTPAHRRGWRMGYCG